MRMFANERKELILALLAEQKSAKASDISAKLGLSMETIRRDMIALEANNLIIRTHGGAILKTNLSGLPPFHERLVTHVDLKTGAARKAVECVREHDVIAVDSGTTGMIIIEQLSKKIKKLTVLTSSVNIGKLIEETTDYDLIVSGGKMIRGQSLFYGEPARYTISGIHPDHTFICPSSVSFDGIGISFFEYTDVMNAYIAAARDVCIVFGSNKVGKAALFKGCDLSADYRYFTDDSLEEQTRALYKKKAGITIL